MFYFLDTDAARSARLLCDDDIASTEPMQEMVGALRGMRLRITGAESRQAEINPWIVACYPNWRWALDYVREMCNEHLHRFRRAHRAESVVEELAGYDSVLRYRLSKNGNTIPPLLIPNGMNLLVVSYVVQYQWWYGAARRGQTYSRRNVPDFILPERRRRIRTHGVCLVSDDAPLRILRTRRRP